MEPIQPSKSSIAYQPTTLGGTSDLGRLANHPHLKEEEKMEAVAKEFEVMLVKQVLKSAQQPLTESGDRKSTRLNSSHSQQSRMPSSA